MSGHADSWLVRALVILCLAGVGLLAAACDDGGDGDADADGDADGDGDRCTGDEQCDDGAFCNGAEACDPDADGADDRGCAAGEPPCRAGETCDEAADDCRPECEFELDHDGDGHVTVDCGGDDCDDLDPYNYPGNVEVCDGDGHDEDCNPETFGFLDADDDGTASMACCNGIICGGDCNDADANINPRVADGPPMQCDGVNNDCDETTDEGCPCVEGETRECGTEPQLDRIGLCEPGSQICAGGAFTEECLGGTTPQEEVCDGLDNDCDATDDDGVLRTYFEDADGDGYGTDASSLQACSPEPGWAPNTDDCDDTSLGVNPMATEVCNGEDDNCDGQVDEGLFHTFHRDFDGDGFGDAATTTAACFAPEGYVSDGTDCDDAARGVSPAALERCDGEDNDCDTSIDPGCLCEDGETMACGETEEGECAFGTQRCIGGTWAECVGAVAPRAESCNGLDDDCDGFDDDGVETTFYVDADGDGFGVAATTTRACTAPAGYAAVATDCDDAAPSIRPTAVELCNGINDDCDASTDEGCDCVDGEIRDCGQSNGAGGFVSTGECEVGSQVCVGGTWGACIGDVLPVTEVCDRVDNDCDGSTDESLAITCYEDRDGDGYGYGPAYSICPGSGGYGSCPAGYSSRGTGTSLDCHDGSTAIHPGATEICNGVDEDCDAVIDTDGGFACYAGQVDYCTNACGHPGRRDCDTDCTWVDATCRAALEYCDYCDDNGIMGIADERTLALDWLTEDMIHCVGGAPSDFTAWGTAACVTGYVRVNSASAASSTVGGVSGDAPYRVGYGPITLEATVYDEGAGATSYGWALVVYLDSALSFTGTAANRGTNLSRRGFALEVFPGTTNFTAEVSSLTGTGLRTYENRNTSVAATHAHLVIQPDWPGSAANEMSVTFTAQDATTYNHETLTACEGDECGALIQAGDFVELGVTAGGVANTSFWMDYGLIDLRIDDLCEE